MWKCFSLHPETNYGHIVSQNCQVFIHTLCASNTVRCQAIQHPLSNCTHTHTHIYIYIYIVCIVVVKFLLRHTVAQTTSQTSVLCLAILSFDDDTTVTEFVVEWTRSIYIYIYIYMCVCVFLVYSATNSVTVVSSSNDRMARHNTEVWLVVCATVWRSSNLPTTTYSVQQVRKDAGGRAFYGNKRRNLPGETKENHEKLQDCRSRS